MTIPWMMNCSHQGEGWCLDCIGRMATALEQIREMGQHPADAAPGLIGRPDRWERLVEEMAQVAAEALAAS
jgi:hypothetical protein